MKILRKLLLTTLIATTILTSNDSHAMKEQDQAPSKSADYPYDRYIPGNNIANYMSLPEDCFNNPNLMAEVTANFDAGNTEDMKILMKIAQSFATHNQLDDFLRKLINSTEEGQSRRLLEEIFSSAATLDDLPVLSGVLKFLNPFMSGETIGFAFKTAAEKGFQSIVNFLLNSGFFSTKAIELWLREAECGRIFKPTPNIIDDLHSWLRRK